MTVTTLVYIIYYLLVIAGFFIRCYFSGYTADDYSYNKKLNRKRYFAIAYNYFIL